MDSRFVRRNRLRERLFRCSPRAIICAEVEVDDVSAAIEIAVFTVKKDTKIIAVNLSENCMIIPLVLIY
jgi:hypothetical protein